MRRHFRPSGFPSAPAPADRSVVSEPLDLLGGSPVTQISTWSRQTSIERRAAPAPWWAVATRCVPPSATAAWARSGGPPTPLLRREVAVKEVVPPPGIAPEDRDAMYERTLREARAAAALSHPSVVQVYDVVTDGDRPWIVMELLDARSLADMVHRGRPARAPRGGQDRHRAAGRPGGGARRRRPAPRREAGQRADLHRRPVRADRLRRRPDAHRRSSSPRRAWCWARRTSSRRSGPWAARSARRATCSRSA